MKKLSISQKLIILIIAYSIPFAGIMIYFSWQTVGSYIAFSNKEICGNKHQAYLEQTYSNLLKTDINCNAAASTEKASQSIPAEQLSAMDKLIHELGRLEKDNAESLLLSEEELAKRKRDNARVKVLEAKWNVLKNQWTSLSLRQRQEKASELSGILRMMISHIGDSSNLILDPDLDSYYIMDITLLALPQAQERLLKLSSFASELYDKKTINSEDSASLAVYASNLEEADLARIDGDIATSINEDPNFYGTNKLIQESLKPELDKYKTAQLKLIGFLNTMRSSQNTQSVKSDEFYAALDALESSSFSLWFACSNALDSLLATRIDAYKKQGLQNLLLGAVILCFTSLCGVLIAWSINRNLRLAASALSKISGTIEGSAEKVASGSQNLEAAASQQTANLEQISASMHEISAMTGENVKHAAAADSEVRKVSDASSSGSSSVRKLTEAMDKIKASSAETTKILKSIDEIAFQTNLLALNAAVEAARAGEAGKGFAVVAEEVRRLAQRSAEAAKSTGSLTEIASNNAENGADVSGDVNALFEIITEHVSSLKLIVANLTHSSKEQAEGIARGIEQINAGIDELDELSRTNAAESLELSRESHAFMTQVKELEKLSSRIAAMCGMQEFKVSESPQIPVQIEKHA